jgi:ribosomal protein L7Ae-like RNA K-turn-binding protein
LPPRTKHISWTLPETGIEDSPEVLARKILTLLQFARKAGKIAHGFESCKKNMSSGKIKLLLLTNDISDNSRTKIIKFMEDQEINIPVRNYSTQHELSDALGLPWTAIIGVLDNLFAGKILSYFKQ